MPDSQRSEPAEGNGHLRSGAVLAKFRWGLCSDSGPTREHNEDFAAVFAPTTPDDAWDRGPVFALADGMGGHAAGEIASRVAIEALLGSWTAGSPGQPLPALRSAARSANTAVLDAALEPGRHGMGTTLTAVTLHGSELVTGHVGDSRAYLVRGDECIQLTTDHSRVAEMLRMKLITPEQAADHPARSQLTRSLGAEMMVKTDLARHHIQKDDVIVLCSDGLWDTVGRADLVTEAQDLISGRSPTAVETAEQLVDLAVKRHSSDNVTAVVVHISSDRPIPPTTARRSRFRRSRS
jgi:serine/threonine protein phosphatase PrpC